MSGHAVVPDGEVVATAVATVFLAVFYIFIGRDRYIRGLW